MAANCSGESRRLMRSSVVALDSESAMAPTWRPPGAASSVLITFFCVLETQISVKLQATNDRTQMIPLVIRQELDPRRLEALHESDREAADEGGELDGNQQYQDLSGATWSDVA